MEKVFTMSLSNRNNERNFQFIVKNFRERKKVTSEDLQLIESINKITADQQVLSDELSQCFAQMEFARYEVTRSLGLFRIESSSAIELFDQL